MQRCEFYTENEAGGEGRGLLFEQTRFLRKGDYLKGAWRAIRCLFYLSPCTPLTLMLFHDSK